MGRKIKESCRKRELEKQSNPLPPTHTRTLSHTQTPTHPVDCELKKIESQNMLQKNGAEREVSIFSPRAEMGCSSLTASRFLPSCCLLSC